MILAADYPFLEIAGTLLVFFAGLIWFYLLIVVFGDLFRRDDISGWTKAAWMIFVIVLPYFGVFGYLARQGAEMAGRRAESAQAQKAQFDEYVRGAAGSTGAASQIAEAKQLLDAGTIDQGEFDAIKAKALA